MKSLGGMVAQYLGDGVLAYFGYPTAHENDAASLKPAADVALQTRIAIG
jgi:class 3 adenylate cyclase